MDNNLKIIQAEVEKYKDTLVLDGDKVVVLRGYSITPEDYYYIFQDLRTKVWESSCVGGFTSLKNQLTPLEYKRLVGLFKMNQEFYLRTQNSEIK